MSSSKHGAESTVATHPTADAIEASAQPSLLFAANGSPDADAAFRFASALARRDDLLLRVLTVLEPLPAVPSHQAGVGWHSAIETEAPTISTTRGRPCRISQPAARLPTTFTNVTAAVKIAAVEVEKPRWSTCNVGRKPMTVYQQQE